MTREEAIAASDAIVERLHAEAGYCGHCGKKKCPGRKKHSELPDRLPVDVVLAAILTGLKLDEPPATPTKEPDHE
jgi:hypothetical protein